MVGIKRNIQSRFALVDTYSLNDSDSCFSSQGFITTNGGYSTIGIFFCSLELSYLTASLLSPLFISGATCIF